MRNIEKAKKNYLNTENYLNIRASYNSGLAQLGFQANFKVGFVLGSLVLNRQFWLTKSPTAAKPQNVVAQCRIDSAQDNWANLSIAFEIFTPKNRFRTDSN